MIERTPKAAYHTFEDQIGRDRIADLHRSRLMILEGAGLRVTREDYGEVMRDANSRWGPKFRVLNDKARKKPLTKTERRVLSKIPAGIGDGLLEACPVVYTLLENVSNRWMSDPQ